MIGFRVTSVDLNSDLVANKIDAAGSRAVRIVGYETMQRAKQSIQPGPRPSQPGHPPRDKTGTLKTHIRYAVDSNGTLVVGAEYLPRKSQDVVQALEHGGVSVTAEGDRIRVDKRPFMAPAFDRVIRSTLPRVLQDSIA